MMSPVFNRSTNTRASARVSLPVWVSFRPVPTNSASAANIARMGASAWDAATSAGSGGATGGRAGRVGLATTRSGMTRRRSSSGRALNSAIHSCIPCGSDMSTPSAVAALNSDLAIPKFAASPMAATNRSVIEAAAAARAGTVDDPGASNAWSSRKAAKAANEAGMELQSACEHAQLAGAPLQQELTDVPGPPSAEVAVAIAPLPAQGEADIVGDLLGIAVDRALLVQPVREAVEELGLGGKEILLVVRAEDEVQVSAIRSWVAIDRSSATVGRELSCRLIRPSFMPSILPRGLVPRRLRLPTCQPWRLRGACRERGAPARALRPALTRPRTSSIQASTRSTWAPRRR